MRSGNVRLFVAALVALLVAACASSPAAGPSPSPTAAAPPTPAAAAQPAAPTSAAASTAALAAVASPAPASSWDQVLAAARQEGAISIIGPPGVDSEKDLSTAFNNAYPDISSEYFGAPHPGDADAKITNEEAAGHNTTDVYVSGSSICEPDLVTEYVPMRDELVGPDDSDESQWLGGQFAFIDTTNAYCLLFLSGVMSPGIYNPTLVDPTQFHSYKDFLDPQWKGKLILQDPTGGAAGGTFLTFAWVNPQLGPDYIRQLFAQNPTIVRDERQPVDFVARGEYAIGLGVSQREGSQGKAQGLSVDLLGGNQMQEGAELTASLGAVAALKNAPHPNATEVYLNWLLSRDGQLQAAALAGVPSRRTDLTADEQNISPEFLPQPSVQYTLTWDPNLLNAQADMVAFVTPLMGG